MLKLLDTRTLIVMISALLVAVFFLLPPVREHFVGYIVYRGLCIGDILFHEMGHALFYWLFGRPAIPSILTAIGADKAGGYTMEFGHQWVVQIAVWAGMAYGCYALRKAYSLLFWPALLISVVMVVLAFLPKFSDMLVYYMGHGGAIVAGGVLLYRAWLNIIVRTGFERWCNALFGFFIPLNNANFAWNIIHVPSFRVQYEEAEITMDFVKIADSMAHWSITGVAWFTLGLCAVVIALSLLMAAYFYEDAQYGEGDSINR